MCQVPKDASGTDEVGSLRPEWPVFILNFLLIYIQLCDSNEIQKGVPCAAQSTSWYSLPTSFSSTSVCHEWHNPLQARRYEIFPKGGFQRTKGEAHIQQCQRWDGNENENSNNRQVWRRTGSLKPFEKLWDVIKWMPNRILKAYSSEDYRTQHAIVCVHMTARTNQQRYLILSDMQLCSGLSRDKSFVGGVIARIADIENDIINVKEMTGAM